MHIHAYLCIFIQMQLEMSQHFHVHCSGPYLACRVGTGHIVDQPIGSTYLYLDLECVALHLDTEVGERRRTERSRSLFTRLRLTLPRSIHPFDRGPCERPSIDRS